MAEVKLQEVCKVYGSKVKAVKEFNLTVKDGEFVVLVGPSGCGKSTTLRMIAGLESITSGSIYIDGVLVNELEPKDRDIAMVFQNYALYPHMSVKENLSYSLKCHHEKKETINERVDKVAKILGLEELLERKPKELSGGQRQRVALGRCLIREPKVFLFDEPLSNLDAALRVQMRSEISKLHEQVKGTFIYVTHDQTEAMTMGDRIVVMKDGVIQQVDTPENLYEHPVNTFVATFLGSPQMNIFKGKVVDKKIYFGDSQLSLTLPSSLLNRFKMEEEKVVFGLRPKDFLLSDGKDYDLKIEKLELTEKLGEETIIYFKLPGREENVLANLNLEMGYKIVCPLYLKIKKEKIHLFKEDGTSLLKKMDMNFLRVKLERKDDQVYINGVLPFENYENRIIGDEPLKEAYIGLHSEDIEIGENKDNFNFKAKIVGTTQYDEKNLYYASSALANDLITFFAPQDVKLKEGEEVLLTSSLKKRNLFDESGKALTIVDSIFRPIRRVNLKLIGKNIYVLSKEEKIFKSKYLKIKGIYPLTEEDIINVDNGQESFTLLIKHNDSLYNGEILYTKKEK